MSCPALQFTLLINVPKVQADVLLGRLKQVSHVLLGQPDGFILKPDLNFYLPVFWGIDKELAFGLWIGISARHAPNLREYLENV